MLRYIYLNSDDKQLIHEVYLILQACGHQMADDKGLQHWIPDYSEEMIKKDCLDKLVVLVYDDVVNKFVSTFQMYKTEDSNLYIRKVATHPSEYGKGIGRENLVYIADFAKKLGSPKICLDVYDKSEDAIRFYKKNGFVVTGERPTRRFVVLLMEKIL